MLYQLDPFAHVKGNITTSVTGTALAASADWTVV